MCTEKKKVTHGGKGDILTQELRVKSYYPYEFCLLHAFLTTSHLNFTCYELVFIYELRDVINCTSYYLLLLMWVTITVYCTKYYIMKCYSLRTFFDQELEVR